MKFVLPVQRTLEELLLQEDTDGDKKITKEDDGPKCFEVISTENRPYEIKGTYFLSNFLQELALAKNKGLIEVEIPLTKIKEAPTSRISRMIREVFWDDLTRTIDEEGLAKILNDDKASDGIQRIYVPFGDLKGRAYFKSVQKKYPQLEVVVLPEQVSPEYVLSINKEPGILSLKLENGRGVPFVVPGGRFNEMYGWDSYFEGVGLLLDGRVDLAKAMVDNFCYQIENYGKILNANRSYYLTRTQPPFLSSFIREVYKADPTIGKDWLATSLETAIKEYETVWMVDGKRRTQNGLNRFFADGIGIPPETEPGHFDEVLQVYARKHEIGLNEFEKKYSNRKIIDESLDGYFVHDRSLRESGHDTSWRLDDVCADLNTVDLNALLFKYENDFAYLIKKYFDGEFLTGSGKRYDEGYWNERASSRLSLINKFLWSKEKGCFYDFNFEKNSPTYFESATNFYPLWANICTTEQADSLVENLIKIHRAKGGILATSKKSIETFDKGGAQKQWDYPNGWAPHQMLIWKGLLNYGFEEEAYEFIYRWLWMITRNAVDYNGTIPEKYDVVACTHKVYAEYGNVGTEFDYITTSGFGWMNASYQLGLNLLPRNLIENLDRLVDPEDLF